MNEIARFAEYAIGDAGGLARCDIEELNREQRRMLHNRDGCYVRPIELAEELRQRESGDSRGVNCWTNAVGMLWTAVIVERLRSGHRGR